MCGIVGIAGPQGELDKALRALRRRGPDDSGTWKDAEAGIGLGHARLSIIDPSPAGHQPMLSPDGRFVMVYNGEIYNYRALRAELEAVGERFEGDSDSEVLLRMYAREGAACFARLNGIFAVAFWDRSSNELVLARDPLGVKPLYITQRGSGLAFASEMKALLRSGCATPEIDPAALYHHLVYLWSPGDRTLVRGIDKLLPGQALRWRGGEVIERWTFRDTLPPADVPGDVDAETAATSLASAVEQAVQRQLVADVPLGAFLSGGLDSSSIVAFAQRHSAQRLQCFTIQVSTDSTQGEGFSDDLPYAERVAKHLGVDLHTVQAGPEMIDRLAEMVYFLDEPTADPAALNTLLISELAASQGIKVLLSGAGGDDLLTGYRRHVALASERWWASAPQPLRAAAGAIGSRLPTHPAPMRRAAKALRYARLDPDERLVSYFFWPSPEDALQLLAPAVRASVGRDTAFAPLMATLHEVPEGVEPVERMLYLERRHFLADHNLNYADKMGMAAGVEIRVPLLDLELVEHANQIPVTLKQRGSVGKWIFKKAMEPYLPADVIYRPKSGFGVPLRQWLHGRLRALVDEVLSPRAIASRGLFDPVAVAKLIDLDRRGRKDGAYTIFAILCVELWCRQHIDGAYAVDPQL